MQATGSPAEPFGSLTPRESELLKRAGERVFGLSRRLADRDREVSRLGSEVQSLRDLLAENREIRDILSAQITSLQLEKEREYEERAELRQIVAGLHAQLQEVIPLLTRQHSQPEPVAIIEPREQPPARRALKRKSWSQRLLGSAEKELRSLTGGQRNRR